MNKKKQYCYQTCGSCKAFVKKKNKDYDYKSACNSPYDVKRGVIIRNVRIVSRDTRACDKKDQIELIET